MTTLEIAIETLDDALAAERGGADSIELSRDLTQDGLTPDYALVERVRHAVAIEFHVIVRPHARNFVYDAAELEAMLRDVAHFVGLGVDGIVFGAHRPDGTLDSEMVAQIADAAGDLTVTLHRAIDSAKAPEVGLSAVQDRVQRVLTSGPASTAWDGRHGLREWHMRFGDKLDFIAAGSIRLEMLPELVLYTGVSGIHTGSAAKTDGVVDVEKVQQLRTRLN